MQHDPKQICSWASPATRVNEPWVQKYSQDLTEIRIEKNAGMQAHGIQGMAIAIIKVLLHKSFLTKFLYQCLKLLKMIYKADTIRNEIMKLHIQHFLKPFSNSSYLLLRWWTVSWVSITEEQRRFEPIKNPAGNSRPHDICRSPTYIYQPTLGSSKQERIRATREYSTPPIQPIATWVHAIPAISPLPMRE